MDTKTAIALYGAGLSTLTAGTGLWLRFRTRVKVRSHDPWEPLTTPQPRSDPNVVSYVVSVRIVNRSAHEVTVDHVRALGTDRAPADDRARPWTMSFTSGIEFRVELSVQRLLAFDVDVTGKLPIEIQTADGRVHRAELAVPNSAILLLAEERAAPAVTPPENPPRSEKEILGF